MNPNIPEDQQLAFQLGVQDSNSPPIALGLTAAQWIGLLQGDEPKAAKKSLNYFDGNQKKELEELFNDSDAGRKDWKKNGFILRTRNVTRTIVEKSGMLFSNQMPRIQIVEQGADEPDLVQTEQLVDQLENIEWQEFFINLDQVERLLKTAIVHVMWDPVAKNVVFDLLHRANCGVLISPLTKLPIGMIALVSDESGAQQWRVTTVNRIIDIALIDDKLTIIGTEPHPFNMVPIVPFYDTNTPRNGFWAPSNNDLVELNEMVNVHITETEWAMSWMKRPTAVTNCELIEETEAQSLTIGQPYKTGTPRMMPSQTGAVAGPNKTVFLNSAGVDGAFYEFKGPDVQLSPMDQVIDNWIRSYAMDWSVRIKATGDPAASSGFQLVVEEVDNLELRKTRQRMMEQGFRRLFRVIRDMTNLMTGKQVFSTTADIVVEFDDPFLPVNALEQENIWSLRIQQGRATEIDYFKDVLGMTSAEAMEHFEEIVEFQKLKAQITATAQPDADDTEDDADTNAAQPVATGPSGEDGSDQTDNQQNHTLNISISGGGKIG